MKKKFFAMYALAGALVASPVFTSCVDDTVSPQVEAQREANIKYKNALTAQTEANTAISQANAANKSAMDALDQEAQRLVNEAKAAENAYNEALNALKLTEKELDNAKKELDNAEAAYDQALKEKKEAVELEKLQVELEKAKADLEYRKAEVEDKKADAEGKKADAESQQITNEKEKATLELDIIKAKLDAEKLNAQAQAELLEAQAKLEKVIKGLELKEQAAAEQLRKNANAIMNGGTANFEALNSWNSNNAISKTYLSTYTKNGINSILALNNGLVSEKMNLLKLENDLVDINTWIAEQVKEYEGLIAADEALIAKYKELQAASSNREDLQKLYDEAILNETTIANQVAELGGNKYNATLAYNNHGKVMGEDPIQKLFAKGYMTEMEKEEYKDTIAANDGITSVPATIRYFDAVLEHTEKDAKELADDIKDKEDDIKDKEDDIAKYEAALEKVNGDNVQRMLTLAKVDADAKQKIYDDVKASEAYKAELEKLEKAVADAQTAFNENPTSFEEQKKDAEGNLVFDTTTGLPVMEYGTKELLEQAEDALKDIEINYIAVEDDEETVENEEKTLAALTLELENQYTKTGATRLEEQWFWNNETGQMESQLVEVDIYVTGGLKGVVNFWENEVDRYISTLEEQLNGANGANGAKEDLEELKEDLEELKGYQAAVAEGSEEMTAYLALCEERKELQKAVFDIQNEIEELNNNKAYWSNLKNALDDYVGDGTTTNEGSLPDWANLIAEAENTIATNKNNIAEIAGADSDINTSVSDDKISKEAAIAMKKAELEAMEAELEVRQAEYDAVMAELEALLEAETEVAE